MKVKSYCEYDANFTHILAIATISTHCIKEIYTYHIPGDNIAKTVE